MQRRGFTTAAVARRLTAPMRSLGAGVRDSRRLEMFSSMKEMWELEKGMRVFTSIPLVICLRCLLWPSPMGLAATSLNIP